MVKLLFNFVSIVLFPILAFSGGNSGSGGVRPDANVMVLPNDFLNKLNPSQIEDLNSNRKIKSPTIIFAKPVLNGRTQISAGTLIKKEWQIQSVELLSEELINSELYPEIQKSLEINDWVEIQN